MCGRRAGLFTDFFLRLPECSLVHGWANMEPRAPEATHVITMHDLYQAYPFESPLGIYESVRSCWYRLILPAYLRRARRVIAVHPRIACEIPRRYPFCTSVEVVYSGMDRTFAESEPQLREQESDYVLAFASADPRKNLERICLALD